MKDFYDNGKQIIGFLVIVLVFSLATNEKTTEYMVLLVLLGMVLLNSESFIEFLKDY